MIRALAEKYSVLPSHILRSSPEELYVDMLLTFRPDGEAVSPRTRQPDDPSLTNLLTQLKAGRESNGRRE